MQALHLTGPFFQKSGSKRQPNHSSPLGSNDGKRKRAKPNDYIHSERANLVTDEAKSSSEEVGSRTEGHTQPNSKRAGRKTTKAGDGAIIEHAKPVSEQYLVTTRTKTTRQLTKPFPASGTMHESTSLNSKPLSSMTSFQFRSSCSRTMCHTSSH